MLQPFRSFQWSTLPLALVLAACWRSSWWLMPTVEGAPAGKALELGPLGQYLEAAGGLDTSSGACWALSILVIVLIGATAAFTAQDYRIGSAGMLPVVTSVLLASAGTWWLGGNLALLSSLLMALAAQRLLAAYRHQAAALPVYDAGLYIGAAVLVVPGSMWFVLWGMLAVGQLRRLRVSDLLKLVFGAATLPLLGAYLSYLQSGDLTAYYASLTTGVAELPSLDGLRAQWPWLVVLAMASGAAVGAFGQLTARRPIQEQRAARMWFTMLAVGWVALLATGTDSAWSMVFLLYPLSIVLGLWLSELDQRWANYTVAGLLLLEGLAYVLGTQLPLA